ncbi:MAG TPA: HAMP domain-containing sensor histidine kinase [Patescibacteria group bacterium]|nr:HAMP domain-containing sensor histidine kinase [Patescibacteria group bacterium]
MEFKLDLRPSSLYSRFILHVLLPPLGVLLISSLIGIYLLSGFLHRQAVNSLKLSATTTSSMLQRELTLRETVLKQTSSELYVIKNEYNQGRTELESDRTACRAYIRRTATYTGAPNGVCDQFRIDPLGGTSLTSFDRTYQGFGEALIQNQDQRINERLTAYKQFFPETMALLILNDDKSVVSSAYSGAFSNAQSLFKVDAEAALKTQVYGKVTTVSKLKLAIFAFKIPGGSVLAAYDINDPHFLKEILDRAPINKNQALVAVLDDTGTPVYPRFKHNESFTKHATALRSAHQAKLKLDDIDHTVVSSPVDPAADWQIAVASPTAVVLTPVRDALFAAAGITVLLMVIFLWVGTFFIRRASGSIVDLVKGAKKFGEGQLQYKIKLIDYSESELSLLADTMNTMARHIAAAELAIDEKNKEFISIATHELRAPLTAIIGNLELFKSTNTAKLNEKTAQKIDQAYSATTRLRDLVNDMLDVARLESRENKRQPLESIDITLVINDVLDAMAVVATDAKIDVTYDAAHAKNVLADKQLLRIIMSNFISNALKYSPQHGKVVIAHKLQNGYLVTTIADTGMGIPKDQQAHIFEKFFRVKHEDRAHITGTGLGMYIVKQYIEQMHGHVSFTSVYGEGTQFSFSLPLAHTAGDYSKNEAGVKD